jgi:small-conductance mechanosensitive channel
MTFSFDSLLNNSLLNKTGMLIIVLLIFWLLIRIIRNNLLNKIENNRNKHNAKKMISFVGYFFSILLMFFVYSDNLKGLSVAIGVAGAGIAFALQEVIASFAGWLAILFGDFYKSGDRVQLGGIKGDVMDIGVLRTTIMETGQWVDGDLYNGRIVRIANSYVFKEPVFNYSGDFPFLWDEIKIPIQFGSDYNKTQEILKSIGDEIAGDLSKVSKEKYYELQNKFRLEDAQTEPLVSIIANDNWVEFTLRYVVNYKMRRATKTKLYMEILKQIEASQNIKFASSTFQLVDLPEIKINLEKNQ